MRINTLSIFKILFPVFFVIAFQDTLFSQGNDSIRGKGLFIGFIIGPSQTQIANESASSVSGIISNKRIVFSGNAEFGYFFTKNFGLSSGVGISSYKTQATLDTYQNKLSTVDSEKEAYEMRISGTGITEDQTINYLTVPVCLNIRLPLTRKLGFFLQTGVDLSILMNTDYAQTGTFTYKGYYPAYNVLLENLPEYGFANNQEIHSSGLLEIEPFTVFATASAGFDLFVQEKIQLGIAASYIKSLSQISKYPSNNNFQLSQSVEQHNSLMGGCTSANVESMGVLLRFRYFF